MSAATSPELKPLTAVERRRMELLERRRAILVARQSFADFIRMVRPGHELPPHLLQLIEALERVERGECRRLLISMPPRHGKTETAVRLFIPWFLGRNGDRRVITASYGQELCNDHGRDVRRLMQSTEYRAIFELELAGDSSARDVFNIDGREGGARFVGRGGAITGRGADLAIIDDVLKNRQEADSELIRNEAWDFYASTLRTRLEPQGAIIVIGTRWHESDLLGRLAESTVEPYERITFPAVDEHGSALWPSRFPLEELYAIRDTVGSREWSALYMADPLPESGEYFLRSWLRYFDPRELPSDMPVYISADLAYTAGDSSDYSVLVAFAVDEFRQVWVLDVWRHRAILSDVCTQLSHLIRRYRASGIVLESDPGTSSALPLIREYLHEAGQYRRILTVSAAGSKPQKARAFQGMLELGRVRLPKLADWRDALETELLRFPMAAHDDQVDALSLIGRSVDKLVPAVAKVANQVTYTMPDGRTITGPKPDWSSWSGMPSTQPRDHRSRIA
jgi:predicted phage terminase large subunit-like protein